ncbi:MAG TPA: PAS domain-containing protein, partial [Spirochaetia bacterium]|nr:PAS domain-containing protein [Spirochaetia bacterium]
NGQTIDLGSGMLSPEVLGALLNALPVEVSFVDTQDKVRYFNQTKDRIFPRSVSVIGRSVQNCHPPQSVHKVNEILDAFRKNERDSAEFWINLGGKFVSIRYYAVRAAAGKYLGCLEVTQDLTELRALQGERRLLDDGKDNHHV